MERIEASRRLILRLISGVKVEELDFAPAGECRSPYPENSRRRRNRSVVTCCLCTKPLTNKFLKTVNKNDDVSLNVL